MTRKLTDVASRLARPKKARDLIYILDFENVPTFDVAALLRRKHVTKVVLAANRTNTVTPKTLATIEQNPERVEVIIGRVTRKEFVDKLVIAKVGEYAFRFPDAEIIIVANDRDYGDLVEHLNDHWERVVPIAHQAPGRKPASATRSASAPASAATSASTRAPESQPPAADAAKKPSRRATGKRSKKKKAATATATATPATPAATADAPAGAPGDKARDNPDMEAVRALLAKLPVARRPRSRDALLNAIRNYRESVGLRARPSTILRHLQERGLVDARTSPVTYEL